MEYEVIKHEKIFSGQIFDVYKDEVVLEHGKPATREYVKHNGASCILPVDNDGKLIFVRQYRHPAREKILEIPAGRLEYQEDPEAAAVRELEEETGRRASEVKFLTKMYSAVGFSSEMLYVYLARGLEETKQNLDADEFVEIEKYTLDEAVEMIFSGEIKDSKTIVALLMYKSVVN